MAHSLRCVLGYAILLRSRESVLEGCVFAFSPNTLAAAVWVFTRRGGVRTQQGTKLVAKDFVGTAARGAVALSADGNTVIVGGFNDNGSAGAAWVYVREQ